ncbi:MAG TPA: glycoside hydrolase family 9 protein [Pyrinomonadaceae bacterium]|nr:glycoside hydrolase family 9 protein [Pyrinomonadaceae bacterium]
MRALACLTLIVSFVTPVYPQQEQLYVRVNQLGFTPGSAKTAVIMGPAPLPLPAEFRIVNAESGAQMFKGRVEPLAGAWGKLERHGLLNFTQVADEGRYVIEVGAARSQPFTIAALAYGDVPDQLLEFMRQQRCGYNPFVDAVCHSFDGRTAFGPEPAGTYLDASGGWHDAGDQLKYLLTSSNATAQMLLAHQLVEHKRDRAYFVDEFNSLGQPGRNSLDDVLDEAIWGLKWMLRLHPKPDQLYHQVADDRDHKGFRLPQNETVDYGWGPGSYRVVYFADGKPQGLKQYQSESNGVANLAGRYAAAMALGYQSLKQYSTLTSVADELLQAGKEVYELGQKQEGVQQGNSYGAPYRYAETTWADDMEWGAAELFRATRERRYLRDAKRYALLAGSESWMGKTEAGHYQYYPFMNLGHFRLYDLVDARTKRQLASFYREGIERTVKQSQSNPYGVGVPFIWCSNNLAVALATQILLYQRMTGDTRYMNFAAKQIDWLLGRNPWGVSMFTRIPEKGVYPRDVHLFPNVLLKRMVRGGLVDGPVYRRVFQSLRGVSIREPDPFAPFQDERAVYHDDVNDYSTNEPTMDGTAAAILLFVLK